MTFITRLHLTNGAYASWTCLLCNLAYDISQENEGDFHLRIEDLDQSRANSWEEQIYEDLSWLGIKWNKTVLRQSELDLYFTEMLKEMKILVFHLNVLAVILPQLRQHHGLVYPGTCRNGKHSFSTEMRKIRFITSNIRIPNAR